MDPAWLNVGSILLGLLALFLPCLVFFLHKRLHPVAVSVLTFFSMAACATSISFQIFYDEHLVLIEDFGALMDIVPTLSSVVKIFLCVTLALNAAAIAYFYSTEKWHRDKGLSPL